MTKIISLIVLSYCFIVQSQPVVPTTSFSYSINPIYIHNLGTQPVTFNGVSVLFSLAGANPTSYMIKPTESVIIQPKKTETAHAKGATGIEKFHGSTIQFNNVPSADFSGLASINIENNQTITIPIEKRSDFDIYLTNASGSWQITNAPQKTLKAKTSVPVVKAAKTIVPTPKAAKTSTLKSAALVMQANAKQAAAKSKTAKAINATTETTPAAKTTSLATVIPGAKTAKA